MKSETLFNTQIATSYDSDYETVVLVKISLKKTIPILNRSFPKGLGLKLNFDNNIIINMGYCSYANSNTSIPIYTTIPYLTVT